MWIGIAGTALVVALGVLPFMASLLPGAVDAAILAAATVGLAAAAHAGVPESLGRRAASLGRAVLMAAPLILAVGAVAGPVGTFSIEVLARSTGDAPWEWVAFSRLPALLAFPAALLSGLVLPPPPARGTAAVVLDRVRLFVAASLIAAVFLGGFSIPFVAAAPLSGAPAMRVLGALCFVAKSVALSVVALRVGPAVRRPRRLALVGWGFAILAGAAAAVELFWPQTHIAPHLLGPVAFTVLACVAAIGVATARRGPELSALPQALGAIQPTR
jgi:hypothetical protein